ncbi:MAG TPA: amino acid adenylation domain-containing protein [Longimicrobium sp.]|nr:amino acid adenylation domain-containing protein [Longimicrobium sp.]
MELTLTVVEQERLLRLAREAKLKRKSSSSGAIEPAPRGERVPLSFAQQRLWFVEQMGGTGGAYHLPKRLRMRGTLDHAALSAALERLVARHESLRTTFAHVDDEPEQRIAPAEASRFVLTGEDLGGVDGDVEAALERAIETEAAIPFDLERGPLIRGHLIRVADDDHVLLLTVHHMVSDGWSMGLLFHELSVLYGAFRRGEADPLPPLEIQYADYVAWQRRWVDGDVLKAQAEYWKQTLAGAPELLELPTDHARPTHQDLTGDAVGFGLDETLTAGLKALSQRHGTTLFMTLMAGWAVVLGRLAGQDDVVIGTPTANRARREIEGLIGFFINTLVLRVELSGAPTVGELLGRVKTRVLEAQQHQDIPFEQVVELVSPTRSLSHSPLFQVTFAWHNTPGGGAGPSLPGLELEDLGASGQVMAKSDLLLTLSERGGRIRGGVTFPVSLFRPETVSRYLGYLRHVLEQMVEGDALRVDRLALMPGDERARVVEGWNDTRADAPEGLAHERFEAQAARTPDAVAVVHGRDRLTYAQLNARANRLAHHLRGIGVGPDRRVAICVGRSADLLVGVLAVLKAGGAYVPLDASYPEERLRYMLSDSAPVAVLTQGSLAGLFDGVDVPVVAIDARPPAWAGLPDTNPERGALAPSHLAYMIYTSGSTGRPKGVMVEHRGLAHYAAWAASRYAADGPRRFALYSSMGFDLTVTSIYVPLLTGGTAVVYGEGSGEDLAIVRVFEADATDAVKLTPSHLAMVDPATLGALRIGTLVVGGEDFKTPLARTLDEATGGRLEIYNEYGPTEVSVACMIHRFDPRADTRDSVPIGRPIANMRVYVLDGRGEPVPAGVSGELYVGGPGVARGYAGRPALTAERFTPDPFGTEPGARLYRTGDVARWRDDGTMEFLGRNDDQVKVRGFRIELGEIEARLAEHAAVREAVVTAREDVPGDRRLVAYWTGPEAAEAETLRAHLAGLLPEHMVPAAYVRLEALPLTPNGKTDRRGLPAPEDAARARQVYEAPQGETEEALAEIWSELLGVERVGRHDHFFQLGGHSLLALTLIQRMRKKGLKIGIQTLFTKPKLAELAAEAGGAAPDRAATPPNRIPAGCTAITPAMLPLVELDQTEIDAIVAGVEGGAANVQDIYPLAPLQEGILFHHLTARDGDPYLLMFVSDFDTRERVDAYLAALRAVIARHDILRTSIAWEELREPVQVVWREARLEVEEVELDPDGGDAEAQLRRRFDARVHRLDLRRAPLTRAYVARDPAADRWVMLRQLHHIIADHVAAEVMQTEVQAHLLGRVEELPAPLPFRNYVAHTRSGAGKADQEAYFKALLGDVTEPTAPYGLLNTQGDGVGIDEAKLELSVELAVALRARARTLGVSSASLCHVAWAQVLARVSGKSDVVFGTVLFGRMHGAEGSERVMGLFINTLPVRVRVGETGVEATVRETHAQLAGLMRHEHASLALAQRCSRVEAPSPLFTSLLNYRYADQRKRSGGQRMASEGIRTLSGEERSNYPLTLAVDDLGERLRLRVKVEARIDARRVGALMHRALEGLVAALSATPQAPLASLDVLPPEERALVAGRWNATDAAYPDGGCVHEAFEARAARTPDAIAAVRGDRRMSYGELNARANRLAHHLRGLGVRPDSRVGICIGRSPDMVVAMLAVLKAGGAYVPLDSSYPAERLRYMLEDSAPVVLLTHSALAAPFAASGVPVLAIDADAARWEGQPETNPGRAGLSPDNLSYVIYTSGSTGRPKGVMNTHRGVVNRLAWMQAMHGLAEGEAVLQNSSFSFDASVFEVFWPLSVGGRLVLVRPEAHKDPAYLIETIRGEGVTTAYFVCSMLQYFLENEGAERCTGLTRVLCGGEALSSALARRVGERLPWATLYNLYGPSESAVSLTTPVSTGEAAAVVPVGRPVANVRVYIVDERGDPAPVGVPGELYVGGVQMARGYVDRPSLTADRFVPDWLGHRAGGRLYRTGDLGRWRPDGTIEFLGRNDAQVKVRGFRIEPVEIETRLRQHPAVRDAVVVAREDTPGDQRLVAYWVAEAEVDPATLRSHLAEVLPEYMIPSAYVRLEVLPSTPNGKVDRLALPSPDGDAFSKRGYQAPVGEKEEALAEIWSEVLGVERVGRNDHFFELGGHSLLAIRLVERMRRRGLHADVRALFTSPTLCGLAAEAGTESKQVEVPANPFAGLVPSEQALDPDNVEWRV